MGAVAPTLTHQSSTQTPDMVIRLCSPIASPLSLRDLHPHVAGDGEDNQLSEHCVYALSSLWSSWIIKHYFLRYLLFVISINESFGVLCFKFMLR